MPDSMTGYASLEGGLGPWVWSWDLRSVNARGLDLKVRAPDWITGLDQVLRKRIGAVAARGSVTVSLRLSRATHDVLALNPETLGATLQAMGDITRRAEKAGVALAPATALELMNFRGISEHAQATAEETEALRAALVAELDTLLPAFAASRAQEGAATANVLHAQLDQIALHLAKARDAVANRAPRQADRLRQGMEQILDLAGQEAPDPQRIAQELALLMVKADVSEELDRLDAHVVSARDILNGEGPMGRRLDFLMQEFNREANTLCAKSGDQTLTAIGLDLKVVIDQLREQVQNLE